MKIQLTRTLKKPSVRLNAGMTLIEVLIALVLGLMISAGMMQVYQSNKQSYRLASAQAGLQESARFALEFLTQDFRMAGYMGCLSRSLVLTNTLNTPTNYLYNFDTPIEGFEWNQGSTAWLPNVNSSITSPLNGSDILTVRRANVTPINVSVHASSTASLTLASAGSPALRNCELVVVSDCTAAAVYQISTQVGTVSNHVTATPCVPGAGNTTVAGPGNASINLGKSYATGDVYRISTRSYYVRNFTDPDGRLIPTLYRRINEQNATAMVEGIEQMQVLYGADTSGDGTANRYFTANAVANWAEVVSVRITLLVRSIDDNLLPTAQAAYNFNGVAVPVADRRLRRQFTTTIAVRNRLG